MFQYVSTLIVMCLISLQTFAKSDILFIDLNNAFQEIKSVEQAVSLTGQAHRLFVLPSDSAISQNKRQKIAEQSDEIKKIEIKIFQAKSTAESDSYYNDIFNLGKSLRDLTSEYNIENLSKELSQIQLEVPDSNFETVIISGHHQNGFLAGELMSLNLENMTTLTKSKFEQFKNVKQLFIFGCNSGQQEIIQKWAHVFSSAKIIIAANDIAPSKDVLSNLLFIKNLLDITLKFNISQTVATPKEAADYLKSVKKYNWPAALLWRPNPLKIPTQFFYFQ